MQDQAQLPMSHPLETPLGQLEDCDTMKECRKINPKVLEIPQISPKDDLFLCMRPILAAGQILGCLPTTGTIKLNTEKLPTSQTCCRIPFVIRTFFCFLRTIICTGLLCMNFVLQAGLTLEMYRFTFMHFLSSIRHFRMWRMAQSMAEIFGTWRQVNGSLWSRKEDPSMKWKFRGLFCLLFTLIFTENWLNSFRIVANRQRVYKNATLLGAMYVKKDSLWNLSFPTPSFLLELYSFVEHKIIIYSLCVLSVFHICLVMAIDTKFKNLLEYIRLSDVIDWRAVRSDYMALTSIVDSVNDFMSVHLLYIMIDNLFFTTNLICTTIDPEGRSWLDGIYSILAISYLLTRFLFLCIPAGNIYGASQKIWTYVQRCPEKEYDEMAQRLERLIFEPTAITCMDLFTITRSFILGFFNGVFALVIVMLQAGNARNS